jgi:hypothetical protein
MRGQWGTAHLAERREDGGEGEEMLAGWTIAGVEYQEIQPTGSRFAPARANEVVTRPSGYVPYQSMFEPDGRHAYDPAGRRYPQLRSAETGSGRRAETPLDRYTAFEALRPDRRWAPPTDVPYELQVYGFENVAHPPPPWRPAPRTPPWHAQDQRTYRNIQPRPEAQGQPGYGYGGAQPGPWDGYASARNNGQGSGGGYGSGGGGYW